jgi:predicted nicotinamide N-methyase
LESGVRVGRGCRWGKGRTGFREQLLVEVRLANPDDVLDGANALLVVVLLEDVVFRKSAHVRLEHQVRELYGFQQVDPQNVK